MLPHPSPAGNNRPENPVDPESLRALEVLLAGDPAAWTEPGSGFELVKQSTVRTVLRGEVGPAGNRLPVHVKLFRPGRLSDRARDAATGARGEVEARNLRLLRAQGLPAVAPLLAGALPKSLGSRSWLVTASVIPGAPFTWTAPPQVLERTGALLRQLHDQGLDLPDLHTGNVVLDAGSQPWLLDATTLRQASVLDLRDRAHALAVFCLELTGGPLDPAARPLLQGYLAAGTLSDVWTRRLAQAARAARLRALVAFGRRSSRACRHTRVERGGGSAPHWFWHESGDDAADGQLRSQARAFALAPPAPDAQGRRGAVWLLPELAVKQRTAAKARALFRAAYWCTFAGVPCPRPVALRLLHGQGLVFMRRLGVRDLRQDLAAGNVATADLTVLAWSLGELLGRLHAHGLRHRDLKFENLVRSAPGSLAVVDLDGLRQKRPTDRRGQGHDLGRVLAAWQAAGESGGRAALRACARAYLRTRARLHQRVRGRHLWAQAAARARQWQSAHR